MVGVDVVLVHQPVQRGAEVAVIVLLQGAGRGEVQARHVHHVMGDQRIDLRKQIALTRVERVVEIKHPVGDMVEIFVGAA